MTALDLIATWPGWEKKTPDEIMASPAWSMIVRYGDDEMRMRVANSAPRDVIGIRIAFDDEEHFLGLGKRDAFPDLSELWYAKKQLPEQLVLALIEKECGNLLQLLENAVRAQLKVIGLANPDERVDADAFDVLDKNDEIVATFSLTLSPTVKRAFGDVANVDVNNLEIRDLKISSPIQYASFVLKEEDIANLKPGDYLLLPEASSVASATWMTKGVPADDGRCHVLADEDGFVTFANLADESLPEIPDPSRLKLVFGGRTVAIGSFSTLGDENAFAIEEVL